jgi:GDPmannose 4,6-dehydratase
MMSETCGGGTVRRMQPRTPQRTTPNTDATCWGYAGDYGEAMRVMLQQARGEYYVIATGEVHSIRDLLDTMFAAGGIGNWAL